MALQFGALRDALIDAGAPPEKAAEAAEEVAALYTSRRRLVLLDLPIAVLWTLFGACVAMMAALFLRAFP